MIKHLLCFILALGCLFQDLAFANPEILNIHGSEIHRQKQDLAWAKKFLPAIPESVAAIEDAWQVPEGSDPYGTVILVQDAHTNTSCQRNEARLFDLLFRSGITQNVFTEAAKGNVNLTFLRSKASLSQREAIGKEYLQNGLLHGIEYLDLTSRHDFKLEGVEDPELYFQSLEVYRKNVKKRADFQSYLDEIHSTVEILKPRLLNPLLLAFLEKRDRQKDDFSEYSQALIRQASLLKMDLSKYPNFEKLNRLKALESGIDFKMAGMEQEKAVRSLSEDDQREMKGFLASKVSMKDSQRGFFLALEEKLKGRLKDYPELAKYMDYLHQSAHLSPKDTLKEEEKLEDEILKQVSINEDERKLLLCMQSLSFYRKLFNLSLTPEEYEEFKKHNISDLKTLSGFLNEKLMNLGDRYDKAVFLKNNFNETADLCRKFYELTYERDKKFIENMEAARPSGVSILITGGYHAPNLKSLFRQKNISYISIVPQILRETNIQRYEEILLAQPAAGAIHSTMTQKMTMNRYMASAGRLASPAREEFMGTLEGATAARLASGTTDKFSYVYQGEITDVSVRTEPLFSKKDIRVQKISVDSLYLNGIQAVCSILFYVFERENLIYLHRFYPNFQKANLGRGRNLLLHLFNRFRFPTYDIVASASLEFRKSWIKMPEAFQPKIQDDGQKVYPEFFEARKPKLEKVIDELERLTDLYGTSLAAVIGSAWAYSKLYGVFPVDMDGSLLAAYNPDDEYKPGFHDFLAEAIFSPKVSPADRQLILQRFVTPATINEFVRHIQRHYSDQAIALLEETGLSFKTSAPGARLATNPQLIETLKTFGIIVIPNGVNFSDVPYEVDWVMDQFREIQKVPVIADPALFPEALLAYPVEESVVFETRPSFSAQIYLGLVTRGSSQIPAIIKILPKNRMISVEKEVIYAQILDHLGVGPRFYGVIRDAHGEILGYAMQLVIGSMKGWFDVPEDIKDQMFGRLSQGGLMSVSDYMKTRTGNYVAIDAGDVTAMGARLAVSDSELSEWINHSPFYPHSMNLEGETALKVTAKIRGTLKALFLGMDIPQSGSILSPLNMADEEILSNAEEAINVERISGQRRPMNRRISLTEMLHSTETGSSDEYAPVDFLQYFGSAGVAASYLKAVKNQTVKTPSEEWIQKYTQKLRDAVIVLKALTILNQQFKPSSKPYTEPPLNPDSELWRAQPLKGRQIEFGPAQERFSIDFGSEIGYQMNKKAGIALLRTYGSSCYLKYNPPSVTRGSAELLVSMNHRPWIRIDLANMPSTMPIELLSDPSQFSADAEYDGDWARLSARLTSGARLAENSENWPAQMTHLAVRLSTHAAAPLDVDRWHHQVLAPWLASLKASRILSISSDSPLFDDLKTLATSLAEPDRAQWLAAIEEIRAQTDLLPDFKKGWNHQSVLWAFSHALDKAWLFPRKRVWYFEKNKIFTLSRPSVQIRIDGLEMKVRFISEELPGSVGSAFWRTDLHTILLNEERLKKSELAIRNFDMTQTLSQLYVTDELLNAQIFQGTLSEEVRHGLDQLRVHRITGRDYFNQWDPAYQELFYDTHLKHKENSWLASIFKSPKGDVLNPEGNNVAAFDGMIRAGIIELSGHLAQGMGGDPAILVLRWQNSTSHHARTAMLNPEIVASILGTELFLHELDPAGHPLDADRLRQALVSAHPEYPGLLNQALKVRREMGRERLDTSMRKVYSESFSSPADEITYQELFPVLRLMHRGPLLTHLQNLGAIPAFTMRDLDKILDEIFPKIPSIYWDQETQASQVDIALTIGNYSYLSMPQRELLAGFYKESRVGGARLAWREADQDYATVEVNKNLILAPDVIGYMIKFDQYITMAKKNDPLARLDDRTPEDLAILVQPRTLTEDILQQARELGLQAENWRAIIINAPDTKSINALEQNPLGPVFFGKVMDGNVLYGALPAVLASQHNGILYDTKKPVLADISLDAKKIWAVYLPVPGETNVFAKIEIFSHGRQVDPRYFISSGVLTYDSALTVRMTIVRDVALEIKRDVVAARLAQPVLKRAETQLRRKLSELEAEIVNAAGLPQGTPLISMIEIKNSTETLKAMFQSPYAEDFAAIIRVSNILLAGPGRFDPDKRIPLNTARLLRKKMKTLMPLIRHLDPVVHATLPDVDDWLIASTFFDNEENGYLASLARLFQMVDSDKKWTRFSFFGPHLRRDYQHYDAKEVEVMQVLSRDFMRDYKFLLKNKKDENRRKKIAAAFINGLLFASVPVQDVLWNRQSINVAYRWQDWFPDDESKSLLRQAIQDVTGNTQSPDARTAKSLAAFFNFNYAIMSNQNLSYLVQHNRESPASSWISLSNFASNVDADSLYKSDLSSPENPGFRLFQQLAEYAGIDTRGWPAEGARLAQMQAHVDRINANQEGYLMTVGQFGDVVAYGRALGRKLESTDMFSAWGMPFTTSSAIQSKVAYEVNVYLADELRPSEEIHDEPEILQWGRNHLLPILNNRRNWNVLFSNRALFFENLRGLKNSLPAAEQKNWTQVIDGIQAELDARIPKMSGLGGHERNQYALALIFRLLNKRWVLNHELVIEWEEGYFQIYPVAQTEWVTVENYRIPIYFFSGSFSQQAIGGYSTGTGYIAINKNAFNQMADQSYATIPHDFFTALEDYKKIFLDAIVREEVRHAVDDLRLLPNQYFHHSEAGYSEAVAQRHFKAGGFVLKIYENLLKDTQNDPNARGKLASGLIELMGQIAAGATGNPRNAFLLMTRWHSHSLPQTASYGQYFAAVVGVLLVLKERKLPVDVTTVKKYLQSGLAIDDFEKLLDLNEPLPIDRMKTLQQHLKNILEKETIEPADVFPFDQPDILDASAARLAVSSGWLDKVKLFLIGVAAACPVNDAPHQIVVGRSEYQFQRYGNQVSVNGFEAAPVVWPLEKNIPVAAEVSSKTEDLTDLSVKLGNLNRLGQSVLPVEIKFVEYIHLDGLMTGFLKTDVAKLRNIFKHADVNATIILLGNEESQKLARQALDEERMGEKSRQRFMTQLPPDSADLKAIHLVGKEEALSAAFEKVKGLYSRQGQDFWLTLENDVKPGQTGAFAFGAIEGIGKQIAAGALDEAYSIFLNMHATTHPGGETPTFEQFKEFLRGKREQIVLFSIRPILVSLRDAYRLYQLNQTSLVSA